MRSRGISTFVALGTALTLGAGCGTRSGEGQSILAERQPTAVPSVQPSATESSSIVARTTSSGRGAGVAADSGIGGGPVAVDPTQTAVAASRGTGDPRDATSRTVSERTGAPGGSAPRATAPDAGATPAPQTGGAAAVNGGGAPVSVGNVSTYSGPVGATISGGATALRVWTRLVNARGGLGGHPVELLIADDGNDQARHYSLVKEMVERRKVIAFVDNWYVLGVGRTQAYLEAKGVPVIGGDVVNPVWGKSPMFFPQAAHVDGTIYGLVKGAIDEGKKKFAFVYCAEVPACRQVSEVAARAVERFGGEVVTASQVSIAQPDFTAECFQAQQRGAQVFFPMTDGPSVSRVAQSCARQGFRPQWLAGSAQTSDNMKSVPVLDGMLIGQQVFLWFLTSGSPAIDEYATAIRQYAPGIRPGGDVAMAWVAAKVLERAAAKLSTNPTAAQILEGLWAIKNDTIGGLTIPLSYNRGESNPLIRCAYIGTIHNGQWSAAEGNTPDCLL